MKNIILFLALIFASSPALARGHRAYGCYYVTHVEHGKAVLSSECFRSVPRCRQELAAVLRHSTDRKAVSQAACFVSRETQSFSIPTWQAKPLTFVLPNRGACLESYQARLAAGDAPTTCHPTES